MVLNGYGTRSEFLESPGKQPLTPYSLVSSDFNHRSGLSGETQDGWRLQVQCSN